MQGRRDQKSLQMLGLGRPHDHAVALLKLSTRLIGTLCRGGLTEVAEVGETGAHANDQTEPKEPIIDRPHALAQAQVR